MMNEPSYIVILVTTSNAAEAEKIASTLVAQREAACVNIVSGISSRFWWEGKIDSAEEALLIIKTRKSLLNEVVRAVKGIHSYKVPEIIALPILGGNQDYLDWIDSETRE